MTTATETLREKIESLSERPKAGIMDQAICLHVRLHKPGTRRKIKSATVLKKEENLVGELQDTDVELSVINDKIDTDRKLLHLSKDIMVSPENKAIRSKDREITEYLRSKALPSIFAMGVWLIPDSMIGEVDHVLNNYQRSRAELVEALIDRWEGIKADARVSLKDMYDEKDYERWPTAEHIRQAFSMQWEYLSYGVNEKLKQISRKLYEREEAKVRTKCEDAAEQIQFLLRESTAEIVNSLVTKLTSKADGKAKQIKPDMIDGVRTFMKDFAARNITGDAELEALVDRAKKLVEGVDPDSVEDATFRDRVRSGFEEIQSALNTMIQVKPARRFRGTTSDEQE